MTASSRPRIGCAPPSASPGSPDERTGRSLLTETNSNSAHPRPDVPEPEWLPEVLAVPALGPADPPRAHTRPVMVGGVKIGGGAPVVVQSMCTTMTWDIRATMGQIERLADAGCE